jgi:hypothetical protein
MASERMMTDRVESLRQDGAAQWVLLSDELLAGLVHSLNNRVTALSVCTELAGLGDTGMLGEGLPTEVARLQRVSALFGLLPARGHPEALEIAPVLDDAIALHAHHPRMRGVECVVRVETEMGPVRVPRWALLRVLLVMLDAAKGAAHGREHETVTIMLSSADDTVRVRAATREPELAYAAEMAALCGGSLGQEGQELVLTLPSLSGLRRRERADRTAT